MMLGLVCMRFAVAAALTGGRSVLERSERSMACDGGTAIGVGVTWIASVAKERGMRHFGEATGFADPDQPC